jgi:hypothetical protein
MDENFVELVVDEDNLSQPREVAEAFLLSTSELPTITFK